MIVIVSMVLGAGAGNIVAARRGGNRLDRLQYGAVFAIIGSIFGLFATIIIERML